MNCHQGVCKYKNKKICELDGKECDFVRVFCKNGYQDESCRHDQMETQVHHDCFLMPDPPREPFFSCYNICKYYDECKQDQEPLNI